MNYRAEWHPGDGAPFLGPERFVNKMAKNTMPVAHLPTLVADGFTPERSGQVAESNGRGQIFTFDIAPGAEAMRGLRLSLLGSCVCLRNSIVAQAVLANPSFTSFSKASSFLTLGRSSMRLKCAVTLGKPERSIPSWVARRQHQKKRASGAVKWSKKYSRRPAYRRRSGSSRTELPWRT